MVCNYLKHFTVETAQAFIFINGNFINILFLKCIFQCSNGGLIKISNVDWILVVWLRAGYPHYGLGPRTASRPVHGPPLRTPSTDHPQNNIKIINMLKVLTKPFG